MGAKILTCTCCGYPMGKRRYHRIPATRRICTICYKELTGKNVKLEQRKKEKRPRRVRSR